MENSYRRRFYPRTNIPSHYLRIGELSDALDDPGLSSFLLALCPGMLQDKPRLCMLDPGEEVRGVRKYGVLEPYERLHAGERASVNSVSIYDLRLRSAGVGISLLRLEKGEELA